MMRSAQFERTLKEGAEAVEAALDLLLPPGEGYPRAIHEAMRYSTLGGGKRLRGILVREAARLGGAPVDGPPGREGASEAPAPAAPGSIPLTPRVMQAAGAVGAVSAAVEMIHAYSLVHDDLPCMDDDDLRRGRPTTHKVFGEGMAVLTGDALLTRAFEVLARLPWAGVDPGAALAVTGELAVAAGTAGLIGGQVVDLESEGRLAPAGDARAAGGEAGDAKAALSYIHAHKTGALFRASLRAGAIVGGLQGDPLLWVTQYAEAFGMAFQIVDDLLDVLGDPERLGKKTGRDQEKGKLTFPALYGVEASRRMAREQVERAKVALDGFGEAGAFLRELADYVLERNQ